MKQPPRRSQAGQTSPAVCYVVSVLFLLFGAFLVWRHEQGLAAQRLVQPTLAVPEFRQASCKLKRSNGQIAFMHKTYAYVPNPPGGPQASYELVDQIRYDRLQACEADLASAGQRHVRSQLWYDQRYPWLALWTLEEVSAAPVVWFTSACAGITLWTGLAAAARRRRRSE